MEENEIMIKRKGLRVENILAIFIILCPILDMLSFLYRNKFNTTTSPSTLLRPIIPMCVMIYIFFRDKKKIEMVVSSVLYGIYALIHLYIFKTCITQSSFGTITHELQYVVNYTYMIMNLFLYVVVFKRIYTRELKMCVLISNAIYIISIFISILTKTSSHTYMIEQMGYKGWFESGNSLSAILTLSMFILLPMLKDKKFRIPVSVVLILEGIFLTTLIGTRVGLYGTILVVMFYIITEIFVAIKNKLKINKLIIGLGIAGIGVIVGGLSIFGSQTMIRRNHIQEAVSQIVDDENQEISPVTGDILKIKKEIDSGTLSSSYMTEANKKSIIEMYNFAQKHEIKNTDSRMQQLIYNTYLVKNQADPILILFGNGFVAQYRELVMEMEIPAMLFNFGIFGFLLYFIPFLAIAVYGLITAIKNLKIIDTQYIMYLGGVWYTFALSTLSGYTFFNSSNMMIIVVINALLLNKVAQVKNKERIIAIEKSKQKLEKIKMG